MYHLIAVVIMKYSSLKCTHFTVHFTDGPSLLEKALQSIFNDQSFQTKSPMLGLVQISYINGIVAKKIMLTCRNLWKSYWEI